MNRNYTNSQDKYPDYYAYSEGKKAKRSTVRENDNDNNGDWRQFFKGYNGPLKGDEPNFEEEGWARRR